MIGRHGGVLPRPAAAQRAPPALDGPGGAGDDDGARLWEWCQRPHGPARRPAITRGRARSRRAIAFTAVVTLDHLILTVNDRDASVRFYTEVMGFG